MPTFIDAFAGAGGASLGFEMAGFDMVLAFDIDYKSVQTLKANNKNPNAQIIQADINDLIASDELENLGINTNMIDLVIGGPPCQGFSVQRIGSNFDERNNLVKSFMQFVKLIRPRFFLMENVPAIDGVRGRKILADAIELVEASGYRTESRILDAADFGVPQRRRRKFVLGELTDSVFMSVKLPSGTMKCKTVRDAIGSYPPPPEDFSEHPDLPNHRRDRLSPLNLERISLLTEGQGRSSLPKELLAKCHERSADKIGHRHVYGRMKWDEPAPTITARFDSFTRGRFGHPEQNRSITLREGATLQSFPESYVFVGSKVEIARQVGNAVPPLLAKAIGEELIVAAGKTDD